LCGVVGVSGQGTRKLFIDHTGEGSCVARRNSSAGKAATDTVSGTYNKSGDTVTFNASKVSSTLLPNGVKYSVTCQDKKLVFKRTGAPDLSFDCSK
jgi:hypothetical protein